MIFKPIKCGKYLSLLMLIIIPDFYSSAQTENIQKKISTRPFNSSASHWYGIRDDHNLVNPVPDQPKYDESDYTKIADNILLFQRNNGGWPKNYDMKAILTPQQMDTVRNTKNILNTTFDNSTTYTHIQYLAEVYTLTHIEKYKEGCLKGLSFIFESQYDNGGWPQYYPIQKENYSRRITFNDGAYIGIMEMLKMILDGDADFAFIDKDPRQKVKNAYDKGLECILNMQIEDRGKLTAWCQQHDEVDLSPAWARAFEPPSICNGESSDIVLFLMDIDHPNERVIKSIQGAVKWFAESRIYNTRIETFEAPPEESKYKTVTIDRKVVTDSTAPPIWTRYYELGTGRPLFCDRNSKYLYSLAEVSRERRAGYGWYTYAPQKVLDKYPTWQKKYAPGQNVLNSD